ncbi:putative mrna transport regulator [Diplodia seriata]|uniref:Putative mrna transport regulator n=1 Tax=Diplodia seriata TaxID=420778 RepID=A0A0G2GYT4_9PEZI|nr:putative mrna transport regulator [Diplodia seriata]
MAANGAAAQQAFAPVLAALATMQSNVDRTQKAQAHEYLEQFQKSEEAWTTNFAILQSPDAAVEAKLFAATTLKGKIVYDLHQLPRESLSPLRDTLLSVLAAFRAGPKPIRMQLCVCLANLAIQMMEWKDVLPLVVSTLGNDPQSIPCVLDFLRVLPEEVTEGRKINLTEDELQERTKELLEDNAQEVLSLLTQYARSSDAASKNPQLMDCIQSWAREVAINDIVNSPLLDTVLNGLSEDEPFESAVECICAVIRETRDVDECMNVISTLYPKLMALRPKIEQAAEEEDTEVFKGIARVFAEAGEAWVVLIARLPQQFQGLVESVLEAAARDTERDAISHTFNFWYELKQYLTLDKYMQARLEFVAVFSKLVDIMVGHLEYPKPESGDEKDLFEGDREQEEKFREFRHQMGDVLKDCCEVIGVTECLQKCYGLIEDWVNKFGPQASAGHVPEWQKLEAPLFAMRAMGRMVPQDENIMLPRLMPLLVQIPDQEKVRFQAVMALGRYTLWTAQHPETLQPQLDYIMTAFNHPSKEVVRAAALSFKFFCNDCAPLLKDYIPQLQQFYTSVLDRLPASSQDELTDGVASVLAEQPPEVIYDYLKLYCDPVLKTIMEMAQSATDDKAKLALAVIEDFFRLSVDVLLFFPEQSVTSQLMPSILSAATTALTLLKEEPLIASLHFLRDFLAYGTDNPPSSDWGDEPRINPPEIQTAVKHLVSGQGEQLTQRIMTGMMYTFPRDCFPDASGVLLEMFNLMPVEVAGWVKTTVSMLPPGSISPQEAERLMNNINQYYSLIPEKFTYSASDGRTRRIQSNEVRKIRMLLQDFTNSYRRRNVAPREGLGRLEATRFRFTG